MEYTSLKEISSALSITEVEKRFLQEPQATCPVTHHFGPGVYIREVFIPAGTFAIGHRQKTEHLNIFLKGKVSLVGDDGVLKTLTAPMIFTAPPGRKLGYIEEDMTWMNVYSTTERDIAVLEETFLDKSEAWQEAQTPKDADTEAQNDFDAFLAETGISAQRVLEESERTTDCTEFPYGTHQVGVFPSGISGRGLFAMGNIAAGDFIAPAAMEGKRTPAGRFINHSGTPNAMMLEGTLGVAVIALRNIRGCRGGELGEEITVDYRTVPSTKKRRNVCQE